MCSDSSDGVALPSTIGTSSSRAGAHDGDVAGVVADAVLLFVAAVVFLVDHDQAGLRAVGTNTAERVPTDHPACPRAAASQTRARSLSFKPRMQCMRRRAEARAEARQRLRGQADFRHQHQRLFAARQAIGDAVR